MLPLLVTALVLPAVANGGPARADEPTPPDRCDQVGIIGGSITVGGTKTLGRELVEIGITDFRIDAKVGRQITPKRTGGITALAKMRASGFDPECLIISLGTNDIPYYNTPAIYRKWIVAMMDAIGPEPRVMWINVYRGKSRVRDLVFNAELDSLTADYPNLRVADWFSLVDQNRSWLSRDGVHPVRGGVLARSIWTVEQFHELINGGGTPDGPPASDCSVTTVPLKYRSKGADVLCLEQRLRTLRYFTYRADTSFLSATRTAVKAWQDRHGLPVTGIVDEATRDGLGLG